MQHTEEKEKSVLCFICRSKKTRRGRNHKIIEKTLVPNSKKPLKAVLLHLAKFIKSELKMPLTASVCLRCYQDLVEYDDFVIKLLEVQQRLTKMIEKSLSERGKASPVAYSDDDDDRDSSMVAKQEATDDEEEELSLADIKASLGPIDEEEISLPHVEVKLESEDDANEDEEEFISSKKKKKKERCTYGTKDKGVNCTVCGLKLKDDEYLELHMNLHEGKTETECRYCNKQFSRKRNVVRHMQVHWDKKFQCDKCGLCFKQQIILWNHKQHHEAEKQPPRCNICNMFFKTKRTYTHHMITHRPDRPRHSCEYCGKTFTEKYTLKVHKRTHSEAAEATEAAPGEQMQHQPSSDQQQQPPQAEVGIALHFNCIICDLQFTNKDALNKHMEREHDVITNPLTITNFSQYEVVVQHEPRKRAKSSVVNNHLGEPFQDVSYLH